MKIALAGLLSWALGVAVYVSSVFAFYKADFTSEDLIPIIVVLSVASLLAFGLVLAPGMFWLRRRLGGYTPAYMFPVSATLLLGVPALILVGLGLFVFGSVTAIEASLFLLVFLVMGVSFGTSFVWFYSRAAGAQGNDSNT